ncbi:hypothetical protein [Flavobacterium sp.]|uniref:hypothetical protein n=1 Tax=Flavobacterium sp. TaxID=239 RepID=UPI003D0CA9A2
MIIKSIEEQTDFRIIYNARKIDANQLADVNVQKCHFRNGFNTIICREKYFVLYSEKAGFY